MKRLLLFALGIPFIVNAQLLPKPIMGYENPNDLNKPSGADYFPAPNYTVDVFQLSNNTIDLNKRYQNRILSKDFLVTNIYTNYDSLLQLDSYEKKFEFDQNNKLTTQSNFTRKKNDTIYKLNLITTFEYNSFGSISKKRRQYIDIDSSINREVNGFEYVYDNQNRLIECKVINLTLPDSNATYFLGSFKVDSFSNNNLPLNITNYKITKNGTSAYGFTRLYYDALDRLESLANYVIEPNSKYSFSDSVYYFYSEPLLYPDSILYFQFKLINNRITPFVYLKDYFLYDSKGKIKETQRYSLRKDSMVMSYKEIYSGLPTNIPIIKYEQLAFKISPNPTQSNLVISLAKKDDLNVSVYNELGESVFENQFEDSDKLNIEFDFKPGVYFIRIQSSTAQSSKKFIVD